MSTCDSMQSQRPVKFSNAQKRQSHIPSNHSSRLSHGQSKCVLVPHKGIAKIKFAAKTIIFYNSCGQW